MTGLTRALPSLDGVPSRPPDPEPDTPDRAGDAYEPRTSRAQRLALYVILGVFVGICVIGFLAVVREHPGPLKAAAAALIAAVLLGFQLLLVGGKLARIRTAGKVALLGLEAVVAYAPLLSYGQSWVAMPGFVAGSALLLLPSFWSVGGFLVVVASMGLIQTDYYGAPVNVTYTTVSTAITGLVVYGLTRLAALVAEVQTARVALARAAVTEERQRFARDLHDLLGLSLSAATLKAELARRLVDVAPDRAAAELDGILDITRQALADVRVISNGYRALSLPAEIRSATSILQAAGIAVSVHDEVGEPPERVGTVLATVLREGVTNVLRHSEAAHCRITLGIDGQEFVLAMVNDGVVLTDQAAPEDLRAGAGIGNLATRVAGLGGRLEAEPHGGDGFRLVARIAV
jgi:two-component system sensor histidine kinase DesK